MIFEPEMDNGDLSREDSDYHSLEELQQPEDSTWQLNLKRSYSRSIPSTNTCLLEVATSLREL